MCECIWSINAAWKCCPGFRTHWVFLFCLFPVLSLLLHLWFSASFSLLTSCFTLLVSRLVFLIICYHRFVFADMELSGFFFAISVYGFCNSGPWTTKQVQHTKGIFPLSVSTGINTGNRYKQSHETIISLPRQPRVFPAYSHERGGVAVSDHLEGAFSGTDDFSYTETV